LTKSSFCKVWSIHGQVRPTSLCATNMNEEARACACTVCRINGADLRADCSSRCSCGSKGLHFKSSKCTSEPHRFLQVPSRREQIDDRPDGLFLRENKIYKLSCVHCDNLDFHHEYFDNTLSFHAEVRSFSRLAKKHDK